LEYFGIRQQVVETEEGKQRKGSDGKGKDMERKEREERYGKGRRNHCFLEVKMWGMLLFYWYVNAIIRAMDCPT